MGLHLHLPQGREVMKTSEGARMKCKWCKEVEATEESNACFMCAEEMAHLMYEATREFGYSEQQATANAHSAWVKP